MLVSLLTSSQDISGVYFWRIRVVICWANAASITFYPTTREFAVTWKRNSWHWRVHPHFVAALWRIRRGWALLWRLKLGEPDNFG